MQSEIVGRVKRALLGMQRYSWEQGVAAQSFLEAGDTDMAIAMAVEGANRQLEDGRCCQIGDPVAETDPCAIGEALLFACEQTGDPFLLAAKERLLRWALTDAPRSPEGIVYHMMEGREFWSDSMYMLPPMLARAGYYDEALRQIDGYWQALFLSEKGLMAHRWDDGAKRFVRRDVWGVGNGWTAAGLTRVIELLPQGYAAQKQRLITRVRTLLDAALGCMLADGRFYNVLDDPTSFMEVNCSQMLAYTIYRGVKAGWLGKGYLPAAEKMRQAALLSVDDFGLVRGVCGMPDFDHCGTAAEGQAFFLLMESARDALNG